MKKRVVIVGCGFGGLNAAKTLAASDEFEILVLDRRNHHLFQPLLYQVAMAGLSPAEISFPIRSVFRDHPNVQVLLATVKNIFPQENKIQTSVGEFTFDYLILACGAEHSYFGNDNWEDSAPGLKTVEQATEIRRRMLLAFERAEAETDADKRRAQMTFVIVGGGPTGMELAGALGEIARYTLNKDFRRINPKESHVVLIEAGPRILPSFDEHLSLKATQDLEKLGVEVRTNTRVTNVEPNGVQLGDQYLNAKTVIWAAGVKPSPLNQCLNAALDNQGRVFVQSDLSLANNRNIFVLGDQAACVIDGKILPGLAPVAIQQGRFVGKQIISGQRSQFRYIDKGQMATIGRKSAVVEFGRFKFGGFFAWVIWLLIHIYYLIGFKNRFFVLWAWTFSYLSYRRGARLITQRDWHSEASKSVQKSKLRDLDKLDSNWL